MSTFDTMKWGGINEREHFTERAEEPTAGLDRVSIDRVLRSEVAGGWHSGSTCSVGEHRTVPRDLDRRMPRPDLGSPCQDVRVIASPWHPYEGYRLRWWTGLSASGEWVREPVVVPHSCLDAR